MIVEGTNRYSCDLFGSDALDQAKASPLIFSPLCEGRIYLRNPATGHRTTLEAATEFLREHVWGGEKIIELGHISWETCTVRPERLRRKHAGDCQTRAPEPRPIFRSLR